ncbi:uncharacterized protein G2W53_001772 [Senna tora]|uniref:Uncharacterized protein n=1 Tax=Senna tora TaxID=362788 RepID=A0A834XJ89_9FABA|nr:uncharacterized protein G2W53_001772 [Senna tora]
MAQGPSTRVKRNSIMREALPFPTPLLAVASGHLRRRHYNHAILRMPLPISYSS